MTYRPIAALLGCLLLLPGATYAAADKKDEKPKWDVNAAHGKTKSVRFSTNEGTWLDLEYTLRMPLQEMIQVLQAMGRTRERYLLGNAYLHSNGRNKYR